MYRFMAVSPSNLPKTSVSSLRSGNVVTVVGIDAEHLSAKRLADMGFVSGVRIRMVRPGDPCIVAIGGTFVGLGRRNQDCVLVSQISEEPMSPCCGSQTFTCNGRN